MRSVCLDPMIKRVIVCLVLCSSCLNSKEIIETAGNDEDIFPSSNNNYTRKFVAKSQPLTLNCAQKGVILDTSDVTWFFHSCHGRGNNKNACDSSYPAGGRPLCGGPADLLPCGQELFVENPQSGIYKCYKTGQKAGYTMTATLVNAYQIEILERNLEPEFVESPENVETFAGSSAVMFCKVRSSLPLHIRWYKQVDRGPGAILYENKYYQSLNGTESLKSKDVHSSKLKFKRVTLKDAGTYACGAVNEAGIKYRLAKLFIEETPLVVFSGEPPLRHWKIVLLTGAGGFIGLLCVCICCLQLMKTSGGRRGCGRSARSAPPAPPRPRPIVFQSEGETSDYEHVITL